MTRKKQTLIFGIIIIGILLLILKFTQKTHNELQLSQDSDLLQLKNQSLDFIPLKLINIPFSYILNNHNLCSNKTEEILAVFIVTSYFGNVETRSSIRQAFSLVDLKKPKLKHVFLLGQAPEDKYMSQNSIEKEYKRYGDIIQGNFLEAYRNLTYKHIMGLKWASKFCSNSKYIIKMDDDIVVNMYNLKFLLDSLDYLTSEFIAGYVLRNLKPIREPKNKWYITQKEYSLKKYPTFISGWFYVTNPKSAKKIVALSNYEKYFWIDDVFVTGILAKKLKMKQFDLSKHFTANSEFLQCCLQDFKKLIACDINIGPNGGDNNMFYVFNKEVRNCTVSQCIKRNKPLNETCVAVKKVILGKGHSIIHDYKL